MSKPLTVLPHESPDSNQLQQRYEDLRAQATGSAFDLERRGHGLSLFLDQGMVAWMNAWSALGHEGSSRPVGRPASTEISTPSLAPFPPVNNFPGLTPHPSELQNQLAMLLAGLALQIARAPTSVASRAAA